MDVFGHCCGRKTAILVLTETLATGTAGSPSLIELLLEYLLSLHYHDSPVCFGHLNTVNRLHKLF